MIFNSTLLYCSLLMYLKTSEKLVGHIRELDPAHYCTSPGLAWDACLKETKQKLQLFLLAS